MIDTWTSIQNLTYKCIIAYWIDGELTSHKWIIELEQIENHNGSSIRKQLDGCMKNCGIKKLLCITVDNAYA